MPIIQKIVVTSDRARRADAPLEPRLSLGETVSVSAFRLLGPRLWGKLYIVLSESRGFLGRLRTQLAKDLVCVSLGPSLEKHHQSWVRNKRTLARKQGIKNLLAIHPYSSHLDFETFLAGFDAGEQWAFDTMGNKPHPDPTHSSISTPESN